MLFVWKSCMNFKSSISVFVDMKSMEVNILQSEANENINTLLGELRNIFQLRV